MHNGALNDKLDWWALTTIYLFEISIQYLIHERKILSKPRKNTFELIFLDLSEVTEVAKTRIISWGSLTLYQAIFSARASVGYSVWGKLKGCWTLSMRIREIVQSMRSRACGREALSSEIKLREAWTHSLKSLTVCWYCDSALWNYQHNIIKIIKVKD